ncbi:ArsC/Spx/MgsR family protein [Lactococcus garvieae]|uniref:Regulatory protein spx n=1 Tax=Lactococcus garvieae TaxID=1363 RepID=A0A1I4J7X2_9LACT|nr:ArsC/Spx/MgsR family protein [Lactococcus garvieae]SFL62206.1 regulatory protein spx [Lactococcus garvieae]
MSEQNIVLYYRTNNSSSQHALEWFRAQKIKVASKQIRKITPKNLTLALKLSTNGFLDILKGKNKSKHYEQLLGKVESMTFSESIEYLINHPDLIRTPIILDVKKEKLLIGYNSEEIRQFIPSDYRKWQKLE